MTQSTRISRKLTQKEKTSVRVKDAEGNILHDGLSEFVNLPKGTDKASQAARVSKYGKIARALKARAESKNADYPRAMTRGGRHFRVDSADAEFVLRETVKDGRAGAGRKAEVTADDLVVE